MRTESQPRSGYVPALGYRWLTRFYDPLLAALLKEEKFKGLLVAQTGPLPDHRILDLGCGTGTLTILLDQACPGATVIGLDGDPEVLDIARSKAAGAGAGIEWHRGLVFDLPFADGSFDRVVSSLVFHHLTRANKRGALAEVRRVLRPGGELHIADWGKASNPLMRLAFLGVQLLDGFETTTDNVDGLLVSLLREAGFESVEETRSEMTLFGTLSLYRATAGASAR